MINCLFIMNCFRYCIFLAFQEDLSGTKKTWKFLNETWQNSLWWYLRLALDYPQCTVQPNFYFQFPLLFISKICNKYRKYWKGYFGSTEDFCNFTKLLRNTKLSFYTLLVGSTLKSWLTLALKCTFLGQNRLNKWNSFHIKKKNFHVSCNWYKSLLILRVNPCIKFKSPTDSDHMILIMKTISCHCQLIWGCM